MTSLVAASLVLGLYEFSPTQTTLLRMVNEYRARHAVPAMTLDSSLCTVADGHAAYMATNRLLTHSQDAELPAFTGRNLSARASIVGWQDELSELVGYANTGLADCVGAIFDSPSHRVRFLKPGPHTLGASASGEFVCLLVGGEPVTQTVVSPPDGAQGIPTEWRGSPDLSGTRSGPGSKLYGYPIVMVTGGHPLRPRTVSLRPAGGEDVTVTVRHSGNDPAYKDSLAVVPTEPLQANTTYFVTVSHTLGEVLTEVRWSFTTR